MTAGADLHSGSPRRDREKGVSEMEKKGGLEGVVAGTSSITHVDGQKGKLSYRGIDIQELAGRSTFEETAYLLWHGTLPAWSELRRLEELLFEDREMPGGVLRMIVEFMPGWDPMESLRTAASALSAHDPDVSNLTHEANLGRAISLTARTPVIVATHHRARQKLDLVPPRRDMSTAANFLYMLRGREPQTGS